ncbi:CrcB family protein [Anaeromyxobacter paludicola]|uniref:Fluoride-specific ion channel FluC n=1 Tax=Anaeromyxobacter paludicola TaxID=2918171 RepID=A0ABM7X8K5_9BACT|nr:CrcB family protein [Anaeromyxobacter paludicola]BDG08122.1 putative fluoride ion transporter CrcB [Anaeromyxobacter paludicola]
MIRFLLVCAAGAAGTGARYLVSLGAARWLGTRFPFGTLTVNVAGSFLLAVITVLGLEAGALSPDVRVVLAVGVMGGFTTYSSFNQETLGFLQRGALLQALAYLGLTATSCLVAGVLGTALARWATGA